MSFLVGLVLGVVFGLALMAAFARSQNARSKHRTELAAMVAAFARMTLEDSRKLFTTTTTLPDCYPSWVDLSQRQKLNWLNSFLTMIWPYVNEATSELIKKSVEPTLEQYRPAMILSSLKFANFTLGTVAPQFTGVSILDPDSSGITMELEMNWNGNPNIVLDVKTRFGGVSLPVQVKDIGFTAGFRFIFKPTFEELPHLGDVRLSLRRKKKFDSELEVEDEITSIPGLFGALEDIVRKAIVKSFTRPMLMINLWNPLPGLSDALEDIIYSTIGNSISRPMRKIVHVLYRSRNLSIPQLQPKLPVQLYVALPANSYLIRTANDYLLCQKPQPDSEQGLDVDDGQPDLAVARWQDKLALLATQARTSLTKLKAAYHTETSRPRWSSEAQLCDLGRDSDNAAVYLQRAKALADRFAGLGFPVSDDKLVRRILRGLGPSYRPFVQSVLSRPFPVTYQELHDLILKLSSSDAKLPSL